MQGFIKLLLVPLLAGATKYAGEFQELGVSARSCGMGGVGVAMCDDAAAIYFNPAASVFAVRSFTLMHAENFGGVVRNEFGSLVLPKANLAAGVGIQYVSVGGIKLTTLPDTTLPPGSNNPPQAYDTVSTSDAIVYLNGSKTSGLLAYGANIKIYYRNLSVLSGLGGGIDLGIRLKMDYLRAGIAVRDFVLSPIIWDNETRETISSKVMFGISPQVPLSRIFSVLAFETNVVKQLDLNGYYMNFGFEYAYKNTLFARAGWSGNYTLGMGLKLKRFYLDYAFVTHSVLDNSNKFSAGLEF